MNNVDTSVVLGECLFFFMQSSNQELCLHYSNLNLHMLYLNNIEHFLFMNAARGSPLGIMSKVLNWLLEVSKFKLQLLYYVHFQTNSLGKEKGIFLSPKL